jgi:hypothetical protein
MIAAKSIPAPPARDELLQLSDSQPQSPATL